MLEALPLGLVRDPREDLEAFVDLQRVGGDGDGPLIARAQPVGERDRDLGLADGGGAEDREHARQYAS